MSLNTLSAHADPVQRDGLEYEFTLVFDLAIEGHVASATKDRTNLFDGAYFTPDEETGQQIAAWLSAGEAVSVSDGSMTSRKQENPPFLLGQIYRWLERLELSGRLDAYEQYVCERYGSNSLDSLAKEEMIEQIALLRQCKENGEKREQFIDILNQQREAA